MTVPKDPSSLTTVQAELSQMSLSRPKATVSAPLAPDRVKALLRQGKSIYGADNRVEADGSAIPASVIRAVCVLFEKTRLQPKAGGYALRTESFGAKYNLCPGQRFRDQPLLGFGSGFLVAPDVIATAGHCVEGVDVKTICAVFDFEVLDNSIALTRMAKEVYFAAEVLKSVVESNGADYALVRLDRKVQGVKPLAIGIKDVGLKDEIYVVGHPVGLPKKAAAGAQVLDNQPTTHFLANLDTFGGNSGSPVLTKDNKVCGILVRGEQDFVKQGECYVATTFPLNRAGEAVCRASVWRELITTDKLSKLSDVSAPAPPHHSDRVAGRQALADFLASAFTGSELRRLVRYNLILEPLSNSLNWDKSLTDVIDQTIDSLEKHGLIGSDFFSILKSERPIRAAEVEAIHKAYTPAKAGTNRVGIKHAKIKASKKTTAPKATAPGAGGGTGGGTGGGRTGAGGGAGGGGTGDGGPDRRAVFKALTELSPGDFVTLIEIEIDNAARLAVSHIEGQTRIAIALINHYDVPYRGLGELMQLIQQRLIQP